MSATIRLGARSPAVVARPASVQRRAVPVLAPLRSSPGRVSLQQTKAVEVLGQVAALDIDWSDPDTLIGAAGAVLGVALGLGIPIFFVQREKLDEERLEELRELNRQTFKETGEYLSPEEIEAIRPPRWTDRREFVDDD
eukprot:CAMPEP_0117677238 /NCGR_PEP_ID=MMETSP0804-20121206/16638_1 /TAXON_ID=1074897 /ORGANISM="Tetraselmis astigmatica, Strain CCMP880" /LENGTH=138 /DNA_ID=CAMNT_0005486507 /DNA_START=113 /DNA_END=529 /DNA_ORIENTATION=-